MPSTSMFRERQSRRIGITTNSRRRGICAATSGSTITHRARRAHMRMHMRVIRHHHACPVHPHPSVHLQPFVRPCLHRPECGCADISFIVVLLLAPLHLCPAHALRHPLRSLPLKTIPPLTRQSATDNLPTRRWPGSTWDVHARPVSVLHILLGGCDLSAVAHRAEFLLQLSCWWPLGCFPRWLQQLSLNICCCFE
jgi:hypothetical protein